MEKGWSTKSRGQRTRVGRFNDANDIRVVGGHEEGRSRLLRRHAPGRALVYMNS